MFIQFYIVFTSRDFVQLHYYMFCCFYIPQFLYKRVSRLLIKFYLIYLILSYNIMWGVTAEFIYIAMQLPIGYLQAGVTDTGILVNHRWHFCSPNCVIDCKLSI